MFTRHQYSSLFHEAGERIEKDMNNDIDVKVYNKEITGK